MRKYVSVALEKVTKKANGGTMRSGMRGWDTNTYLRRYNVGQRLLLALAQKRILEETIYSPQPRRPRRKPNNHPPSRLHLPPCNAILPPDANLHGTHRPPLPPSFGTHDDPLALESSVPVERHEAVGGDGRDHGSIQDKGVPVVLRATFGRARR